MRKTKFAFKGTWKVFLVLLFCAVEMGFGYAQTEPWMDELQTKREETDKEFSNPETSILPESEVESFKGLHYFDIKSEYRVKAKFKRIKNGTEFKMKTTTTRLPVYKPYGVISFKLNGAKYRLTVYQNIELSKKEGYEDYLFLPFTDLTNGETTYGGGRYIDLKMGDLKKLIIDFNAAYNPYCAYNSKFSCPIPPSENHLEIAIEAGVQKYHD
jgi:uncharacterized protein (DUF1684 family)